MAGEGTIELCFTAIRAALEGIQTANGYRHDVKRVYRTFDPMLMENLDSLESPALALGRTPGADAAFSWLDERGYEVTVPVTVMGYLKRGAENAEDDLAAPQAEAFISDIVKRVMVDSEWGTDRAGSGHIKNTKILATDHSAAWDSSGIFVEVRFEFYAVVDGTNP